MSFPPQPFGFVAGRWVRSIGDTPDDPDRAPDYVPVKDTVVVFTPQATHRVAADGSGWAGIIKDRIAGGVGERGQLIDAEGHDHLALAAGIYSVSYDFGPGNSWPSHYIEVKTEHTAEAPLWLPPIAPPAEGPMIENRVVTIPAGGLDGQILVWDGAGFKWVDSNIDEQIALAQQLHDNQVAVAGLTGEDDAVKLLVADGESQTRLALDAWVRSVKAWGATGDGVTNDTPALQQAVDDMAAAGGGTLYLPTGRYVIDAPGIKWASNVSLVGDGPGKSVLASAGDLTNAIWQLDGPAIGDPDATPLEDVTFEGFEIDASGLTHTEPSVAGKGIFILYMRRGLFRNLYIHDTIGTGLGCDFLADTTIENVVAENCGRNYNGSGSTVGQSGIGIGTHAWQVENVTVANCHTNFNGNHGIFVETQPFPQDQTIWSKGARFVNCYAEGNRIGIANKGSGGTTFTSCEAVGNTKYGFASLSNSRDDLFVGCKASGNTENGFYVENTLGGVTISACQSFDNGSAGIAIRQSSFATWAAAGFTIGDCLVARNGHSGIMLAGITAEVRHVTITGNHIIDNGQELVGGLRQGIRVEGTVSDLLIQGNWVGNSDLGAARTQVYAVHVTSGTIASVLVASNMFRRNSGANAGGWLVEPAATVTDAEFRGNHGVKDRSRGTGTILSGNETTTVAHGLPTPPQFVIVTPKDGGDAVWVDTIGAGGVIYRRAGTSGPVEFMWQAEV